MQELLNKGYKSDRFAVEMFMFVQGRTDASRKWGELVEAFIFKELGLLANRADPCTYSGLYKQHPVILCRATDDFLLICRHKETYDAMIIDFRKKWTVHALDEVKMFFGIRFICSDRCVTLDQTHKIKDIVIEVFGPSSTKQQGNKGCSTPMIAGTEYGNDLVACTPYTPDELVVAQKQTFGFRYRHILGGCMHCALWTRLDILTACLVLAQYQASPGSLHFRALKHLVGYLRLHPDIPLTFNRSTITKEISAINFAILDPPIIAQVNALIIDIVPTQANQSFDSNPTSFTSCADFHLLHSESKRSPLTDNARSEPIKQQGGPIDELQIAEINRISPPITECLVDANLPGGLYERMATS
jgi:hypothetical protein